MPEAVLRAHEERLLKQVNPLIKILDGYKPVEQQEMIELLMSRHALASGLDAGFVMMSMTKHAMQMLGMTVKVRLREV